MKRVEKDVIRAGLEAYLVAEEQRDLRTLRQLRERATDHRMHDNRRRAEEYHGLAKAQVIIIRRIRFLLNAVRVMNKLYEGIRQAEDAPTIDLKEIFESDDDRCVKCGLTRKEIADGFGLYGSQSCHGEFEDGDNIAAGFRYPSPGGEHQFEEVPI